MADDTPLPLHITAVQAGLDQGNYAIKILLENPGDIGAMISAYTLAGAAEEMFSRLIKDSGDVNAYALVKKEYEKAGAKISDPNVFRNWLKHASYKNPETGQQEVAPIVDAGGLKEQVAFMIIRASINLTLAFKNSATSKKMFDNMGKFQVWLEENIPELYSEEVAKRANP